VTREEYPENVIQDQLLSLSLEVKLFRSLILNKIKEIKADMNAPTTTDDERIENRYCKMMMTISNNLVDYEPEIPLDRRYERLDWCYGQVLQTISRQAYSGFWPNSEMARCLLSQSCKTIFSESKEFMYLVKQAFTFNYLNLIYSSAFLQLIILCSCNIYLKRAYF
jgi:hypothetical protein